MSGSLLLVIRVLLALALYAFLGWTFIILWRDLKAQGKLLAARQAPPISLADTAGGKSYRYVRPDISVGRDPVCDCCLEDKTVSLRHARLSYHHRQWWVEDLGSTNGTFLNQEPVTAPMVVTQGDRLGFGQVLLVISIGDGGA